jgi:hypothetical protein
MLSAVDKPIIVSFSGGRTSAYMLRLLLDNYPQADLRVVFANTGQERPETLDFVQACAVRYGVEITWLEALVTPEKGISTTYREVDYVTACRPEYSWNPHYGQELGIENPLYRPCYAALHARRPAEWDHPLEAVLSKFGIANNSFPHCTREAKIQVLEGWIKERFAPGSFHLAIGMRADEPDREGKWWYPLMEWNVRKAQMRAFWKGQPFDLGLKDYEGNCDLCWKKGHNKNLTLLEEYPVLGLWWAQMEQRYSMVTPATEDRRMTKAMYPLPLLDTLDVATNGLPAAKPGPHYFNHNAVSMAAMQKMAERGRFRRVKDEEETRACACGVAFDGLLP